MPHDIKGVREILVRPGVDAATIMYENGQIEVLHFDHLRVQYLRHTDGKLKNTKEWEEIIITGFTSSKPFRVDREGATE